MQTQVLPQGVYMDADQASLVTHPEVQEIDQKLAGGCWACYNCWTYVIGIMASLTAFQAFRNVFAHPIFLVSIVEAMIEMTFVFVMQEVIKVNP